VARRLASQDALGMGEERRVVRVLGDVDDAVDARHAVGVQLELPTALRSGQEGRAPHALQLAAMFLLSRGASRFPEPGIAAQLSALQAALVLDLLEARAILRRRHDTRMIPGVFTRMIPGMFTRMIPGMIARSIPGMVSRTRLREGHRRGRCQDGE
jgi:hypothetical protein